MRALTNLEHVLLALIATEHLSGYALRKSFASSPLAHFSDSPGSIYPALKRLHRRGLLLPLKAKPANGRREQRFTATARGLAELRHWLQRPITRAEVLGDFDDLLLRFVFRAQMFGNSSARKFVLGMQKPVQETIEQLEAFLRGPGRKLTVAGRLAVEQGLEGYRGHVRWAARVVRELRRSTS